MDLDEGALKLIDPENLTQLNTQPIHTIRVWGVGRDNGRYVFSILRPKVVFATGISTHQSDQLTLISRITG